MWFFLGWMYFTGTHKFKHTYWENNKGDSKFEVTDYVRILKYKSIFVKDDTPN